MQKSFADLADRLTVLTGYCELLLNESFGPIPDSQRLALETIFKASAGAQQILREAQGGSEPPPPLSP